MKAISNLWNPDQIIKYVHVEKDDSSENLYKINFCNSIEHVGT